MISGNEPVEVHSAREARAVELNLVPFHVLIFVYKRLNLLTEDIIYRECHMRRLRYRVVDFGRGVKRVGVVL